MTEEMFDLGSVVYESVPGVFYDDAFYLNPYRNLYLDTFLGRIEKNYLFLRLKGFFGVEIKITTKDPIV